MNIFSKKSKEGVKKVVPASHADPMNDTRVMQLDYLDSEAQLEKAKEDAKVKEEEIKRQTETCIRQLSAKKGDTTKIIGEKKT